MIQQEIEKILKEALLEVGYKKIPDTGFIIEIPQNPKFGDYATNCISLAKALAKTPLDFAQEIVKNLKKEEKFRKVEVAGSGFINFYLSEKYLADNLKKIISYNNKWPNLLGGKGKIVVIDYSAPNIAKPFGIGHLRSTIIGQAVYNMHNFLGYKTIGDNHFGDWGTQFGKIIYAIKNWGDWEKIKKDPINQLQRLYIKFHLEAEKNSEIENEGRAWFRKLEKGDKEAHRIWRQCVRWSLQEFNRIYNLLDVKFDYSLGESFYQNKMADIIKECKIKKLARMSDGAMVIFYPSNLTPGIIVKSDGATTYLTRDLATLKYRLNKFKPKKIIYHVGNEQILHFRQLFETARLLGWGKKTQLVHASHGLIRTEKGKFSTRAGRTINLEELINSAIDQAKKIINERGSSAKNKNQLAKIIGIGAVKYTGLSSNRKTDVIFDWNKMFALEGNSAPYLQYAYTRCKSLLAKAKMVKKFNGAFLKEAEERTVLSRIVHFEEVVGESAENEMPNLLADYLYNLASEFNSFYNKLPVLKAPEKVRKARLSLVLATSIVLKKGLELLGIKVPIKM